MHRRCLFPVLALVTAWLLGGCVMVTVQDMYHPPKRSKNYAQLQSVMDEAMADLSYCAPLAGENRQTVQQADLTGDGVNEYLLFAKGDKQMPLRILIFTEDSGAYRLHGTIESYGSAFEQVEYADIDGKPGMELIVGRQVSDQVPKSVSVYSYSDGDVAQLMSTNYYKFLTCDLDGNGKSELLVIGSGETEGDPGWAALYSDRGGGMERSAKAALSGKVTSIKRIMVSRLHGGYPAVYVASSVEENAIITDVFALKYGQFTNISLSNESGTSVQTLRNYYVYAEDIDGDGILELPSLITMQPVATGEKPEQQYLIRWFSMDFKGGEVDKLYSFHNYQRGWYLELDEEWARRVSVEPNGSAYVFYVWNEEMTDAQQILSIHVLTGSDREDEALDNNRFVLYRTEDIVYAARLETASAAYGITQETFVNSFHLIWQDWKTGET